MLRCEEAAVIAVAPLWQVLSEIVIENAEGLACLIDWEQEKVRHEQRVKDEDGHECSPENDVRSSHDRVRQVDRAHYYKGKAHADISTIRFEVLFRFFGSILFGVCEGEALGHALEEVALRESEEKDE